MWNRSLSADEVTALYNKKQAYNFINNPIDAAMTWYYPNITCTTPSGADCFFRLSADGGSNYDAYYNQSQNQVNTTVGTAGSLIQFQLNMSCNNATSCATYRNFGMLSGDDPVVTDTCTYGGPRS